MGDLLSNNKPFILKVLVGILGTAFAWLNKKYNLGVDPIGLATVTASLIVGIAIHAAAADHGLNAAAASDAPKDGAK